MSAIQPPAQRIWWNQPIDRVEGTWIAIALILCLIPRFYQWYPLLEFEQGKSYRVHLSSMDYQHGFSLQPLNINMQIIPGYETVVTFTPDSSGEFTTVCNEYCRIGHHTMLGKIYVVK